MMRPCKNCKSSKWNFRYDDDTAMISALCMKCGLIVSFMSKRGNKIRTGVDIGTGVFGKFIHRNGVSYLTRGNKNTPEPYLYREAVIETRRQSVSIKMKGKEYTEEELSGEIEDDDGYVDLSWIRKGY